MRFMFVMESFLHNIFTIFIFKRCHYSMYMSMIFIFIFCIVVSSMDVHIDTEKYRGLETFEPQLLLLTIDIECLHPIWMR